MKIFKLSVILGLLIVVPAFATPILTNVEPTSITDTSFLITWNTTNETADSCIQYGISYIGESSKTSSDLITYHSLTLDNLMPNTTYKYRVKSTNSQGVTTYGDESSFITMATPQGKYLFTFATIDDPHMLPDGSTDIIGPRGIPFSKDTSIFTAVVSEINAKRPDFVLIKGDIVSGASNSDTVAASVRTILNSGLANINGITIDSTGDVFKYMGFPGDEDKYGRYPAPDEDWITTHFKVLNQDHFPTKTSPYTWAANGSTDSVYNYSFDYKGYHFICLDGNKAKQTTGLTYPAHCNTTFLTNDLEANKTKPTLIFSSVSGGNLIPSSLPDAVLSAESNGEFGRENFEESKMDNSDDFENIINTYKSNILGIFMGGFHDNDYKEIYGVPHVRIASSLQFPSGYAIYKVYEGGILQTFYKCETKIDGVPAFEIARSKITAKYNRSKEFWEALWLGTNISRNLVCTTNNYAPSILASGLSPANGASDVPNNVDIRIAFTKPMNTADTEGSVSFSPDLKLSPLRWENNNSILVITHSAFEAKSYTVTIGTGATDTLGNRLAAAYSYSFTAGSNPDRVPPVAAFNRFVNDVATDDWPIITGSATDEFSIITSIECRVDGGSWSPATPYSGAYNSKTQSFYWTPSKGLTRGVVSHEVEVRCTDAANNINVSPYTSYKFYIVGLYPEIGLKASGIDIISGDPIDKNPSCAITTISNHPPVTARVNISKLGSTTSAKAWEPVTLTADPANPFIYLGTYSPTLSDGKYDVIIEATDSAGNVSSREVTNLLVQTAGDLAVQSTPLSYPNPYNPDLGSAVFSYLLSKSSNLTITIHDLMGNQVAKKNIVSGQLGGKAGYNEVPWNGKDDNGNQVGSGIYIYLIVGDGKLLSRGKITVLK